MSEITTTDQAKHVVDRLERLLEISNTKTYEETLKAAYKFPLVEPLKRLRRDLIADEFSLKENDSSSVYEKTLVMRSDLQSILSKTEGEDPPKDSTLIEKRNIIAKWIVGDWGGIRSNQLESLVKCIELAMSDAKRGDGNFAIERIASWSKYLAFKTPQKYAIYDAKVIYSLNWLIYQSNLSLDQSDCQPYFPFLSGQNSVMGLLDYQIHIFFGKDGKHAGNLIEALKQDIGMRRTGDQIANSRYLSALKKLQPTLFIPDRAAFSTYYKFLAEIAKIIFSDLDNHRLTKVEMLLFSIADAEIAVSVLEHVTSRITKPGSVTP